jgi:exodeoxyribonuclease III
MEATRRVTVATWNVNSVRSRLPRLLPWLERRRPDVVCLQETKVVDEDFPRAEIEAAGYRCLVNGQKTYNGVAILSRDDAREVARALPGDSPDSDRRVLAASLAGIDVACLYCPNGGELGSDKYAYKLDWYRRLRALLESTWTPDRPLVVCGDFNIAPEDRDVWDPELWRGQTLFSEPEKQALRELMAWGLEDTLRRLHPEGGLYTWWDFRQGAFHRGWGLRIDHVLATPPLAARCLAVDIDRDERKGEKPSDHAPVIATFEGGSGLVL